MYECIDLEWAIFVWQSHGGAVQHIDVVLAELLDQPIRLGLQEPRHGLSVRVGSALIVSVHVLQADGDDTDRHSVKRKRFENLDKAFGTHEISFGFWFV